ncbi:MAG: tetratricopeptide repeat protein [Bdellovibrionota bacterium]
MSDEKNILQLVKEADQLRLSGEYEKSIEILEKLVSENAFFAPAKLSLGRSYFEFGKLSKAALVLEEYVEFVPEHVLANKILARIYAHEKKFEQARKKVQIILQEAPDDTIGLKLQDELMPSAMDEFEQDDTVKTAAPTLTPTMAELYYHQGHIEEARKIYEQLLAHDPQNKELQEKLRMIVPDHKNKRTSSDGDMDMHNAEAIEDGKPSDNKIETLQRLLRRVEERR